jgi:hypothetical protein
MALVTCKECGKELSTGAATCPHCGAPGPAAKPAKKSSGCAIVVLIFLILAVIGAWQSGRRDGVTSRTSSAPAVAPAPSCGPAQIEIVSTDGGFVDECTRTPCPSFKGVGVLRNNCPIPVGVQLKITALDAAGKPLATREMWPASVRNISPGEYTFSMDTWLDPDPKAESFRVEVVDTKEWR